MIKKCILLLSLCLLFILPVGKCSAGGYLITDQELTKLEQNLAQLESNLIEQTNNYQTAKQSLKTSDEQVQILTSKLQRAEQLLIGYDKQIAILQAKLIEAQQSINQTSDSLESANRYLNQYEKEVKQEIRKLTWQRNVALIALTYMATKK